MNTLKVKTWLNNLLFSILPAWMKRMVILKDALKHLHSKKMLAETGAVMCIGATLRDLRGGWTEQYIDETQLQDLLIQHQGNCHVCQRGALLFAYVWRNNKFKTNSRLLLETAGRETRDDILLQKFFSLEQLMMMERAFEGRFHELDLSELQKIQCSNFYSKWFNTTDRMGAILENAIRNWGIFHPEQI